MYLSSNVQISTDDLQEMASWTEAEANGFRTRTQWKRLGKGCKGKAAAAIQYHGHPCRLYHADQTTTLTEKTKALEALLDRFATRDDLLVWKPHKSSGGYKSHDWVTTWSEHMPDQWKPRSFIRQGWNLERCYEEGIVVHRDRHHTAQAFSIRGPMDDPHRPAMTDVLVIDLDCHTTNATVVAAHLQLVQVVIAALPRLLQKLYGGSVFFQYRTPEPSGLQIWVVLKNRLQRKWLHHTTRKFLLGLEKQQPGLNTLLADHNLPTLDSIEILPTENQQVTIPGSYGKAVFTTKELRPVKGWFDVVGLEKHIAAYESAGAILARYPALFREFSSLDAPKPKSVKKTTNLVETDPVKPHPILHLGSNKADGKRYWTDLKTLAINGVPEPDQLYGYIRPLAQALYFRDFARHPNKTALAESALLEWVINKSNGHISRGTSSLHNVIKHLVRNIEITTPRSIKDYYKSILLNDLLYPNSVQLISGYMASTLDEQPPLYCTYCKCELSQVEDDSAELPQVITDSIDQAARRLRKGKARERFTTWAEKFITHLYNNGKCTKSIGWKAINQMMATGKEITHRHTQDRYKALLVKAGVLESGWEKFIRRGAASAKYTLTTKAAEALRLQRKKKAMTA